jgi:hypothetical protein
MTEEELEILLELSESKKKKRKQKRRKNSTSNNEQNLAFDDDEPIIMSKPARQKKHRHQQRRSEDDFNIEEHRKRRSKGRGKGTQARRESVDLNQKRSNRFIKERWSRYENRADRDRPEQLQILYGKETTERNKRSTIIEAKCRRCGYEQEVSTKLIVNDNGEPTFVCDRCINAMK